MDIKSYLKDLLTIDCDIQSNLQNLLLVTNRDGLEKRSNEIKRGLKEFKEKLKEMKDFCDMLDSSDQSSSFINRLSASGAKSGGGGAGDDEKRLSSSPTKTIFQNELMNQKEHLFTIESRFRNTYLAAQVKLDQMEREVLFQNNSNNGRSKLDPEEIAARKRQISAQMLVKQSNEMTNKLDDINRQIHQSLNQTSDIIPVLDNTSKTIKNVQQEFGGMSTAIKDGRRLLTRLSQREFTDKLLMILCMCFFFTVVFYIVWKRLF